MNILVIGGMHGNEPLGVDLVKMLQAKPIKDVAAMMANKEAVIANKRFTNLDLNRSFPGNNSSSTYEEKRAAMILDKAKNYDIVLDFHNTHCPNNDCGFVGDTANKMTYDVSWFFGLDRVIVADYDCINKYATNCLSVEISLDSNLNNISFWYQQIRSLSRLDELCTKPKIERYRFVYRMTLEDRDELDLPNRGLTAFRPIRVPLANKMGVKSPAYPIFIGDTYTPYNYGGLLNKITGLKI